jgi:hypothetical protein
MVREESGPLVVVVSVPGVSIDAVELGYPGEDALPMLEYEREQDEEEPIPDAQDDDGDGARAVLPCAASSPTGD